MQPFSDKMKSLQKAMAILECFIDTPKLGITEICQRLELNKSNVHDILSIFKEMGYVAQDTATSKYYLGLKMLDFSHSISSQMIFRKNVMPHMQELATVTGETVFMGICDGYDVVYLDGAFPQTQQNYRTMFGFRAPLYCTGLGKAILSVLNEDEWNDHIPPVMHRFTEYTICDVDLLHQELREIRERGYSIDNMEHEFGIKCVAMPLINSDGNPRGGISISGPSPRFTTDRIQTFVTLLKEKCDLLRNLF